MEAQSMKPQGVLDNLAQGISAQPGIDQANSQSLDGSTSFSTIDSEYLRQNLSGSELSVLNSQINRGIDFSHLTESQVADLFL